MQVGQQVNSKAGLEHLSDLGIPKPSLEEYHSVFEDSYIMSSVALQELCQD